MPQYPVANPRAAGSSSIRQGAAALSTIGPIIHIGRSIEYGQKRGPITIQQVHSKAAVAAHNQRQYLDKIDTRYSGLIRGVIEAVRSVSQLGQGTLYRLTFSPSATKALADGTLSTVASEGGLRAWTVNSATQAIAEHGILAPCCFPKAMSAIGVGWHLAAMITAQKFLADISRKLANICDGIDSIRSHVEEDQNGRVLGNLKYLSSNREALCNHPLLDLELETLFHKHEDIKRESFQHYEAFHAGLSRALASVENLSVEYDGHRLAATSLDQLNNYLRYLSRYSMMIPAALLVRAIAIEHSLLISPNSGLAASQTRLLKEEVRKSEGKLRNAWEVVLSLFRNSRIEFQQKRSGSALADRALGIWECLKTFLGKGTAQVLDSRIGVARKAEISIDEGIRLMRTAFDELDAVIAEIEALSRATKTGKVGIEIIVQVQPSGETHVVGLNSR